MVLVGVRIKSVFRKVDRKTLRRRRQFVVLTPDGNITEHKRHHSIVVHLPDRETSRSTLLAAILGSYGTGVDTSKGRKCLRCRKCIVSTNYDKY